MRRSTFIHLNMLAWIFVCLIEFQIEREKDGFDIYRWIRRFFLGGMFTFVLTFLVSLLLRNRKW
jgi:hypothetical protein